MTANTARSLANGKRKPREAGDWYIESRASVQALIDQERFVGNAWDPCCGWGTIPRTFWENDLLCSGTDIVQRSEHPALSGATCDFLSVMPWALPVSRPASIVMNPPYGLAQAFVNKALVLADWTVCALLRLGFLSGRERNRWFEETPPARVYVFSDRISMPPGEGYLRNEIFRTGGTVDYAWFVWDRDWRGEPVIRWIEAGEKKQLFYEEWGDTEKED